MPYILIFHPDDHPAHLKKVGNWVISFPPDSPLECSSQLIIRSVIPPQMDKQWQLQSLEIQQTEVIQHWEIVSISYFDGTHLKELNSEQFNIDTNKMINGLILELKKYDVYVKLQ
ncbi:hypothetical protein E0H82_05795 [Acinetobacter sp. ANC 4910]|uniref:hypothetical protein n=1 Tax=Acinetobacter sp. ANC 4910 TaxID=2529850 RepID=UPI001040D129|nr:hypothetical protein [Acinetobacter sp. ANC 4910]TCB36282.1 hypothetical protein E0H82_05795 [Acinetobacter sp. ANC 4910]